VRELLREGNSERDVAEETGVNKSRVHRIREKMIREGEKLSDSKGERVPIKGNLKADFLTGSLVHAIGANQ
jgi:transposase